MKHHEMKRTDVSYTSSRMAKDTEAWLANLNVFLDQR